MGSEPYIGDIMMVGFNFAPRGWALCDGQLLSIAQNTALFSLLGTVYGGNGTTNFALPDLRGRVPVGFGQGPGLSSYSLGESGGVASVTLIQNQMPGHTHTLRGRGTTAISADPADASLARAAGGNAYAPAGSAAATLAPEALPMIGGSLPHENRQPFLSLNFCIALLGIYPSRS